MSIAHERQLTPEQQADLSRILEEQPTVVYAALRDIVGNDGQIEVVCFIFIHVEVQNLRGGGL